MRDDNGAEKFMEREGREEQWRRDEEECRNTDEDKEGQKKWRQRR